MKIGGKHYTLIFLAILSIIFAILGYLFIYRQTIIQAEHYLTANKEVEDEDLRKQNEQELVRVFSETKEERQKISNLLVKEDRIVDFIEMVEGVGRDSGAVVELSSIDSKSDKVTAKVSVKGTWSGIMKSLILLENLPISSSIDKVRMNITEDTDKKSKVWNMSMDIEALVIK